MTKIAVTIPEAAQMVGLGRSSIYELFRKGELRPLKAGKRTLVLVEDLEKYVRSLPVGEFAQ